MLKSDDPVTPDEKPLLFVVTSRGLIHRLRDKGESLCGRAIKGRRVKKADKLFRCRHCERVAELQASLRGEWLAGVSASRMRLLAELSAIVNSQDLDGEGKRSVSAAVAKRAR